MTPKPPYYAVVFTSFRTADDAEGYGKMAEQMEALASEQPGYLGIESARENLGITISYWDSLEAIQNWKNHTEHTLAREKGRALWYKSFKVRICRIEREYEWER